MLDSDIKGCARVLHKGLCWSPTQSAVLDSDTKCCVGFRRKGLYCVRFLHTWLGLIPMQRAMLDSYNMLDSYTVICWIPTHLAMLDSFAKDCVVLGSYTPGSVGSLHKELYWGCTRGLCWIPQAWK